MFRGASTLSMDSKGRIAIPAKHRDALTKLVIAPNPMPDERCLLVYALDEWQVVENNIVAQPNSPQIRRLKRVFLGEAVEYVVDGQGRVLLTPELREFAGLDKKVKLVGQGNKLEIWSEAAYQALRNMEESEEDKAAYVATLESLSF
ncbi:MAG: cell division/cell wall cluster transcriptional repressor MraZ [Gammaproteobacteria bacterium]|nr:MAG: cell division/cell wall cluster transcriptional repressor MraZ [Gammaproteobacteria bacterium]